MIASRWHSTMMAGCLALGLADVVVLNLVLFPLVRQPHRATPPPILPIRHVAVPAPVVAGAAPAPREVPAAPEVTPPAPAEAPPASRERVLGRAAVDRPEVILFATGLARLDHDAREAVDSLARRLADVPSATLVIDGHTDVRGPETRNDRLSRARARAVMQRLEGAGIGRRRLVVRGFGSRRPAAGGADADSLRRNRRVEVSVRRGTS